MIRCSCDVALRLRLYLLLGQGHHASYLLHNVLVQQPLCAVTASAVSASASCSDSQQELPMRVAFGCVRYGSGNKLQGQKVRRTITSSGGHPETQTAVHCCPPSPRRSMLCLHPAGRLHYELQHHVPVSASLCLGSAWLVLDGTHTLKQYASERLRVLSGVKVRRWQRACARRSLPLILTAGLHPLRGLLL